MVVVGDDDTLTGLLDCGVDASRVGFSRAPARAVETVPTAVLIVLVFIVFARKVALIEVKRVEILSILEQNTARSEGAKTDRISARRGGGSAERRWMCERSPSRFALSGLSDEILRRLPDSFQAAFRVVDCNLFRQ